VSDFGDFEPADAHDTDLPDAEASTRILFRFLRRYDPDHPDLDDLHPWVRAARVFAVADWLARLRREGGL
jgi:hypothetical protein